MIENLPRTAVIGAGISGLTAGKMLADGSNEQVGVITTRAATGT